MNQYKIGLGSLFSLAARTDAKAHYVKHWDNANGCWNVFKKTGVYEDYVTNFVDSQDAQDYCDMNNGVLDATGGE